MVICRHIGMKRVEDLHKLSPERMLADYHELGSLRLVAKKYGTSHGAIKNAMGRLGLGYRRSNHRRLPLNHGFFSIGDKRTAYWAGFLAADGCVYKKYVKLSLAQKDLDHLKLFRADLESAGKLTKAVNRNGSVCYSLAVSSEQMVRDLSGFGVTPNKTKTLRFPVLDSSLLPSFCRGYFDGDGCWSIHRPSSRPNRKGQLVFSTRGTENFLSVFNRHLVEHAGLPDRCLDKSLKGWRTSVLQYNGNLICGKIASWLYSDLTENERFLARKLDVVQTVLGHTHDIVLP
jgi:hypothetical protein